MIKNDIGKLMRGIANLINMCIRKRQVPEEYKTGYMSSLHKTGDRQKCENYRGITVTLTLSRLYERILRGCIEEEYMNKESEE